MKKFVSIVLSLLILCSAGTAAVFAEDDPIETGEPIEVFEPVETHPLTTEPVTEEPETTEPLTTEPVTTEPVTTEPVTTEPVTTEAVTDNGTIPNPEKTDEEIFEEYLKQSTGCLTYLKSEKLGEADGVSIFFGCTSDATDTFVNAHIGDYMFSKFYIAQPYDLAVYAVKDGMVYPLEGAYEMGVVTDLEKITELVKDKVSAHKLEGNEAKMLDYLEKNKLFGRGGYYYAEIGELNGYTLVQSKIRGDYYKAEIDGWNVDGVTDLFEFTKGMRLFLMKDDDIISLDDACADGIVSVEDVAKLYMTNGNGAFVFSPIVSNPTEEVPDPYIFLKRAVCGGNPELSFGDIDVILFSNKRL